MIVLFTDFGWEGPYVGQMKAVLAEQAPGHTVIDLCHDVPPCRPELAAYLLAACYKAFPPRSIFVAVVDPGVGSARDIVLLRIGDRHFIAPDNGLLAIAARQARADKDRVCWHTLLWRPDRASRSFHGRDILAPAVAKIATGKPLATRPMTQAKGSRWPADTPRVIYVDRFGNVMIGLRATTVVPRSIITVRGHELAPAATFSDVPPGTGFWYENANGLVELAVNQGRAVDVLHLAPGDTIIAQTLTPDHASGKQRSGHHQGV